MKGYYDSTGKTLYVFPQTAGEIPYVDSSAEAIAVQLENIADWVEENGSVADLMVPYNYNTMTIQKKVWSDHLDDDIVSPTPPPPPAYDITLAGPYAEYFTLNTPDAPAYTPITVTPSDSIYYNAYVTLTTTPATDIAWSDANTVWTFTMPTEDVTVTTATATHAITLTGDAASYLFTTPASTAAVGATVTVDSSTLTLGTDYTLSAVTAGGDSVTIDIDGTFTMPADSVIITGTEVVQTYTLTLTGDDILENTMIIINDETVENTGEWEVDENDDIKILYLSSGTYNTIQVPASATIIPATDDTAGGLEFTMPAEDTAVIIDYVDGSSSGAGPS